MMCSRVLDFVQPPATPIAVGGATLHTAINKIACCGFTCSLIHSYVPGPSIADRGGSGKTIVVNHKHPGLNTRSTCNRMVATQDPQL